VHAAYAALVQRRAAAEVRLLLVPFAGLKLVAAAWRGGGSRGGKEAHRTAHKQLTPQLQTQNPEL